MIWLCSSIRNKAKPFTRKKKQITNPTNSFGGKKKELGRHMFQLGLFLSIVIE